ncbi:MAG: type II-A CRISPR-associated protein Csn2 [Muribaculaceae bacterium]|nr:type II-A CRISPR-associated protein Csn2 [Muribaculaceae bacterium]
MKLVHKDLKKQIVFGNSQSYEWVIESPEFFAEYVQELYVQSEGGDGNFILSEEDKEIDIGKYVEVIINPFSVNINDKKVLNKLYAELTELAYAEDMYLLTQDIKGKIQTYFLQLEHLSPYILTMDSEIDITAILKGTGVKIDNYADNFFENLEIYIQILSVLLQKKLIVLVNVCSYIGKEQVEQLMKLAIHTEIELLLIENQERNFSKGITKYIIDKDGCEI